MGNAAGQAYLHRLVMGDVIGRPLYKEETVHHKNGNKTDNSPDNLELWSKNHGAGQRVEDMVNFLVERYEDLVREKLKKLD